MKVAVRPHPQVAGMVDQQAVHVIIGQRGCILRIMKIIFEIITVEPVQAIIGDEPHKPLAVLNDRKDIVLGESVVGVDPLKTVVPFLGSEGA